MIKDQEFMINDFSKKLDGIASMTRTESYNVKTLCERREAKKFVECVKRKIWVNGFWIYIDLKTKYLIN